MRPYDLLGQVNHISLHLAGCPMHADSAWQEGPSDLGRPTYWGTWNTQSEQWPGSCRGDLNKANQVSLGACCRRLPCAMCLRPALSHRGGLLVQGFPSRSAQTMDCMMAFSMGPKLASVHHGGPNLFTSRGCEKRYRMEGSCRVGGHSPV